MKMKFGALVVDGRNKIGGQVASKNRGGSYLRTKVTPTNPQTAAQSNVRSAFTSLSQIWRTLTQAQRNAWNAAVTDWQRTDIFGDIKSPSGFNLYMRLNQNLLLIGEAMIDVPPLAEGVANPGVVSVTAAAGTPALSIVFAETPVQANTTMVVEATPPMSAGRNFVKSNFRKIAQVAAAGTSPFNALTAYQAKFGDPVAGQKITVRLKCVSEITGETSQYSVASTIVAP